MERKILIKIDRISAWVLFAGVLLYFISGYGMTKGIIDAKFSSSIHLDILSYIILLAFLVHAPYAIHMALKRWKVWNIFTQLLLVIFFMAFGAFVIYAESFYEPAPIEVDEVVEIVPAVPVDPEPVATPSAVPEPTSNVKTFTASELAQYDGQNSQPAYVAVDGDVYDLTNVFPDGFHYSHFAGKDLTDAFYARHAKSILSKYPVIGQLK